MKYKYIRFEKNTRYYSLILDKDLFNDWVLTIINGRINTQLGQIRKVAFKSYNDALKQIEEISLKRHKRGYSLLHAN